MPEKVFCSESFTGIDGIERCGVVELEASLPGRVTVTTHTTALMHTREGLTFSKVSTTLIPWWYDVVPYQLHDFFSHNFPINVQTSAKAITITIVIMYTFVGKHIKTLFQQGK